MNEGFVLLLIDQIKLSLNEEANLRRQPFDMSWFIGKIGLWVLILALVTALLLGGFSFLISLLLFSDICFSRWLPSWIPVSQFDAKEWLEISAGLLSLAAVASIPIVLEKARKSEARQAEISRLANTLSDRSFYVEVLAVTWEVASKFLSWSSLEGDSYRVQVAGAMTAFQQVNFSSPEMAGKVPFQNRIRFHDHAEPLSGFDENSDGSDYTRPNEHMILTIWLNFWRDVERDIFHRRVSEEDAYERLSDLYSWFHDFHQQLWMIEFILKALNFQTANSLNSFKEIASLEARFKRKAKAAGVTEAFCINDSNWKPAYEVAVQIFKQEPRNAGLSGSPYFGPTTA